jgi:hypothetical protein
MSLVSARIDDGTPHFAQSSNKTCSSRYSCCFYAVIPYKGIDMLKRRCYIDFSGDDPWKWSSRTMTWTD